jgi:tetratricopeptide (TPR) repeat protein
LLINGDSFIPKEGWLWDYKERLDLEAAGIAKTILQIVSFYNTCGGYLIYGVKEEVKDKLFIPVTIDFAGFNPAQLRDKIRNFTGSDIDVTFNEVDCSINDENYKVVLLHIPQRPYNLTPVMFERNGPDKKPVKPVFKKDETYLRQLDENICATTSEHWGLLYSQRRFDAIDGLDVSNGDPVREFISYNLPDRNLICSEFIGRIDILGVLWAWLSYEFEYTKILSGDGGKGKTSIAYEFCLSFIQSMPAEYERVLWLSAKEKQFSGIDNNYFDINEPDFNDSCSFLECLAENCALDMDNYDESSVKVIKKALRLSLPLFPSLIIVDDVDSLQEDEQRKVADICRQLGSSKVRFLITTRKKFAYSSDVCVDVAGLPFADFSTYIESLVSRYKFKKINKKGIEKLHEASDGSPLLSSSILRLVRVGVPLDIAIRDWKGEAGENARNTALKREIDSLTPDAKRILLTIFYFKNCSYTELKQAAGVPEIKLADCLEELKSLFLVNEPKLIDSEERVSISGTTRLLVSTCIKEMAHDHHKLETTVKTMKKGLPNKKKGNQRKVGMAINQALALLKEGVGRYDDAIETVEQQLRLFPINPDLLLMKARCLLWGEKPNFEEARKILRSSIGEGQSKILVYEFLYRCETELKSVNGIIEASSGALKLDNSDPKIWHERLARGLILRSKERSSDAAVNDLMAASESLTLTLKLCGITAKDIRIQELNNLHNMIWSNVEENTGYSWLSTFDIVIKLIQRGDVRTLMYMRAIRCLKEAKSERFTDKKQEAFDICLRKFENILDQRNHQDKEDRKFDDLIGELRLL